jgi:hypothetical protein
VSFGSANSPLADEAAVLTRQGIPLARARQALRLQALVAETHLAKRVEVVLGGEYAGVWLEPAAAKFHIGVTSKAAREAAKRLVAQAGLTVDVVETPVRSTWSMLIAAQNHWNERLTELQADEQASTGLDPSRNAVSVTLSSAVPSAERATLESEAAVANERLDHCCVTVAASCRAEGQMPKCISA